MSELSAPLMSASDPFYAVRDALEQDIKQLRIKFDSWQGLLNSVNTATDTNFRIKHEELKANISKSEDMCRKVKMAVMNVERNRIKYPHIDDRELANRKTFVTGLEDAVVAMRDAFTGRETQGKLEADNRRELHSRQSAEASDEAQKQNAYNMANADYMSNQQQKQQVHRQEQDKALGNLSAGLTRIGEMANAIDNELNEQKVIIEDVERGVDETQSRMDQAIKGVEKLLKTRNNCQLATIATLVVIFVILAVIALS